MNHRASTLAARVHAFGPPDAIVLEGVDLPPPAAGEVRVRIEAAGVGPWDAWIRSGRSALPQPLPLTLGSDFSGVVESVGEAVSALECGDEVFGATNPRFVGAYATRAVASAGMIAKKPSRLSHIEAASVPVVAVTASQALFDQAKVRPGQRILIHGAAGNVGAFAVQMARRAGLHVTATATRETIDLVRGLGANDVIDHRAAPFEASAQDIDAVIDFVGGDTQERSFAVIKPGGVLISAVSEPDQTLANRHEVHAAFFLVAVGTAILTDIATMIERRDLQTNVGTILPFADVRSAHEMLDGTLSHPRGKIVLRIPT